MNLSLLRQSLRSPCVFSRSVFVPPAQLAAAQSERPRRPRPPKPAPESTNFYTARPVYYDQVTSLEKAIATTRTSLKNLHLLPLPDFARKSLPPLHPVWKNQQEMGNDFQDKLTTTRYRRVTRLLNQLNDYHRIANTAGHPTLANGIYKIVELFESGNKAAMLARGKRKKVVLDQYGRSYTIGKRKTSAARVWMIPIQQPREQLPQDSPEVLLGLDDLPRKPTVTPATILVNNIPLNEYFPIPADRERVTRSLKVAGALGAYNVFALVRGGGTTGQSDALGHGIAKGLVAHNPKFETVFRRGKFMIVRCLLTAHRLATAKLTRRDPRMVERKKTGMAKARKRVRSLSLISFRSPHTFYSIPGSSVRLYAGFSYYYLRSTTSYNNTYFFFKSTDERYIKEYDHSNN
jgi:small subunit ribosomal protein S9